MALIIFFFVVLAALIWNAAVAQEKRTRLLCAFAAFGWSCLMFNLAGWAQGLGYNIWYSGAASKMLNASIEGIEDGRKDAVLIEMKRMAKELHVTYERRGNFKELAERAAQNLANHASENDD